VSVDTIPTRVTTPRKVGAITALTPLEMLRLVRSTLVATLRDRSRGRARRRRAGAESPTATS